MGMYTKLAELFRWMITYFSLFPIWTSSVGQGSGSIVSILSDSMNMVLMALVDQWTSRLTMADLVVQYWWHFDVEWKKIADIAVIPALLEVFSHVFTFSAHSGWFLDDVVHVSSCFHRVNKASMEGQSDVWPWIVVWICVECYDVLWGCWPVDVRHQSIAFGSFV